MMYPKSVPAREQKLEKHNPVNGPQAGQTGNNHDVRFGRDCRNSGGIYRTDADPEDQVYACGCKIL